MPLGPTTRFSPADNGSSAYQRGFTLMEILITVVIMSVGLLGLAGLQFDSLRGNQNAYMGSVATSQAWDAADRLRANIPGVDADNYTSPNSGTSHNCQSSACSSSDLAEFDKYEWHQANADLLPDGQGVICVDSTPDDGVSQASHECDGTLVGGIRMFAVKVWWDDDRNPDTALRRHVMSFIP